MRRIAGLIFLWLLCGMSGEGRAQADGRMHQYMFNQLDFNPAYAGSTGLLNVYANARQEWVGFGKGAPQTVHFGFDMPFAYRALNKMIPGRKVMYSHGAGVHFLRDALGFMTMNGLELSYTGRLHLRATGHLAFGLGLRGVSDKFDAEWRGVQDVTNDPAIPRSNSSSVGLDLSFGLYFNTDKAFIGVSGQNLLGSELRDKIGSSMKQKARMDFSRQYYLVAGYDLPLNSTWNLQPATLVRTDFVQHIYSLSLRAMYNNLLWFGANYYIRTSIGALVGVNLFNGFRIGYSYDYPLTEIRHFTSGSHELFMSYTFSLIREKIPQQYKSIRFL